MVQGIPRVLCSREGVARVDIAILKAVLSTASIDLYTQRTFQTSNGDCLHVHSTCSWKCARGI